MWDFVVASITGSTEVVLNVSISAMMASRTWFTCSGFVTRATISNSGGSRWSTAPPDKISTTCSCR